MRRASAFDVRSLYAFASGGARCTSVSSDDTRQQQLLHDHDTFLEACYHPTNEECQQLASPIMEFLGRCTCYDMMGTSTQVVVLDMDVALTVAFIAAQETRLNVCVLWDPIARVFSGVLSSTDYVEILLYCRDHPDETEQVARYTIRQWREKRQAEGSGNTKKQEKPFSSFQPIPAFLTCAPETSLSDCLQQMLQHRVRHVVLLAEKEARDLSVVAILDLQQILTYLGAVFLSIEAAGNGRHGVGCSTCGGGATGSAAASSDCVGPTDFDLISGDVTLPPHVRNLLLGHANDETDNPLMGFGRDPIAGPYCAIVDVPFCYVSQLGRHRNHVISVTLDTPFLEALRLMLQYDTESIAVVSEEKIIVDVIDRSDVVRIEDQGVYDTKLTVREALGSKVSGKTCVFHPKDALRDIFIHFVRNRVKELFLVDPDTDVLLGQLNVAEMVFFLVFGVTKPSSSGGGITGSDPPSVSRTPRAAARVKDGGAAAGGTE